MKLCVCCNLLKMLCFPPCPRSIIEHAAFQPPPPTYTFNYDQGTNKYSLEIKKSLEMRLSNYRVLPIKDVDFSFTSTKHSTNIVCMYYAVKTPTNTTILYSHGNGSDLGSVMSMCVWMAMKVQCNIIAYDYSGYGRSSGKPSEKRIYADIDAAYKLLLEKYNCSPEDVILMGQSLGSAPTLDLASRTHVRGVIIQSGFASALNVAFPREEMRPMCCDVFQNIDKVSKVSAPVLVIHGTEDEVIEFNHGMAIYEKCAHAVEPLWLVGARHNDVEVFKEFVDRLIKFIHVELPAIATPL